jgi:hypothetical protein
MCIFFTVKKCNELLKIRYLISNVTVPLQLVLFSMYGNKTVTNYLKKKLVT